MFYNDKLILKYLRPTLQTSENNPDTSKSTKVYSVFFLLMWPNVYPSNIQMI